jgi:hypothetical protein
VSVLVETKLSNSNLIGRVPAPILYPSYRSFDDFIDVEHLRSLNSYITNKIKLRLRQTEDSYFLNQHRLNNDSPYIPGVREIWLSRTRADVPYKYLDLDKPELWQPTAEATEFTLLTEFIRKLPFEATGRILIIYDVGGREVPAHRDHERADICNEFIWFRTNLNKPFYLLNERTGSKLYVHSYSAWFDTVNQFHGSDAVDGLTFSIRVDGIFNGEFRRSIPRPEFNAACTPSLWACTKEGGNAGR